MDGAMTNTDAISTEKGAPAAPAPKADLKSMDLPSLEAFVRSLGEPAYRGRQLRAPKVMTGLRKGPVERRRMPKPAGHG